MCYLRSVSEILLWCKSSSFSTKSSCCSLSVSTFPPDPFLPPCDLPSLLALLPSPPPPPPTSSSSSTSPNCSSPSRDWLLDRNWLKMETEGKRAAHAKQERKTKQSMNNVNNKRKKDEHRDIMQPRLIKKITENRNADLQQKRHASEFAFWFVFFFCFDIRQHPKRCNVFYVSVCAVRYGQTSPTAWMSRVQPFGSRSF